MLTEVVTTVEKPYVCQFCNTAYMKEKTLSVHMCEQKRRHLAKTEKHVQLGYQTYVRFYQLSQRLKGTKTYQEFANSPYYAAFIKFGSFLSNVNPLYPNQYIDWVVTSGVKLDHWCREELYDKYVLELIKTEPAEIALQRSVSTMLAWAESNESAWNHYFSYISLNRAVYDIRDGKMSAWLLLNAKSGKEMLSRLNDEQLEIISPMIDPVFWQSKFNKSREDLELVREVIKEGKL